MRTVRTHVSRPSAGKRTRHSTPITSWGDLSLVSLPGGLTLAVACDSSGAIGPKPADEVSVSGYVVGRFIVRVPLMELLAIGAEPWMIVNTLCVEPDPTGSQILKGIRDEARVGGLNPDICITGSSEKNIPTSQTGVGITVLGHLDRRKARHLWTPRTRSANAIRTAWTIIVVGIPKVGSSVHLDDPEISDIPTLAHALAFRRASRVPLEIVPVGSRGIAPEARDMARRNRLGCTLEPDRGYEGYLTGSAGPSTCFLVSIDRRWVESFMTWMKSANRPCWIAGTLDKVMLPVSRTSRLEI